MILVLFLSYTHNERFLMILGVFLYANLSFEYCIFL